MGVVGGDKDGMICNTRCLEWNKVPGTWKGGLRPGGGAWGGGGNIIICLAEPQRAPRGVMLRVAGVRFWK